MRIKKLLTDDRSLFFKDAGIDYKELLYKVDATWPENKKKLLEQGITRTGQLPAIEYDGHKFNQVRASHPL